jgi:hypothetical protein
MQAETTRAILLPVDESNARDMYIQIAEIPTHSRHVLALRSSKNVPRRAGLVSGDAREARALALLPA